MTEGRRGFWRSIPGLLTAAAGLITAIGGILAILLQAGVIGGDQTATPPAAQSQRTDRVTGVSATTSPGTTSPAPPAGKPWSQVTAVFTTADGRTIEVRGETVRYCFSGGAGVNLNDTQSVPFEMMASLEIVRSDEQFAPGGKADVVIELVGGRRLDGTIGSGCEFFGFNDLGRVGDLYPQRLKKIEFRR